MVILALTAALLYGSADFLGGVAARRASPFAVMAVTMPAGAVVMLAVAGFGATLGGGDLAAAAWAGTAWAVAGGVAGAVGLAAFYAGFARAPMSVVAPVSALTSTVLPVGVAVVGGERPGVSVVVGAVACLAAIVLVSAHSDASVTTPVTSARRARLRGLGYGALAGASFGLFFLFMKYAGHSGVLWPVAVQRLTGSVVALAALAATRTRPLWRGEGATPRLLVIALASGVVDATANVCYILATRAGEFGLAVVITSLYPGATVLLARLVLRERVRAVQQIGLVLAAVGIVLVTA
jgi:drug/metabolite transporter (DMT)-like permease